MDMGEFVHWAMYFGQIGQQQDLAAQRAKRRR